MFSKDNRSKSEGTAAPRTPSEYSQSGPSTPSIISTDLHITGDLSSHSDIQIDGRIDGDVDSKSVTIGESAEVNGTIVCDRIRVCGLVTGEIKANTVVIARTARINGDIAHNSLEIEAGATLEGGIRRLDREVGKKDKANAAKDASVTKLADAAPTNGRPSNDAAAAM